VDEIPRLDQYQIIVGPGRGGAAGLPPSPQQGHLPDWSIRDPSAVDGDTSERQRAYEQTYDFLHIKVQDLVENVLG
jgi:hypothetical protein